MGRSPFVVAALSAGALALTACSGAAETPSAQAPLGAAVAVAPASTDLTTVSAAADTDRSSIAAQGTGTATDTPDVLTIALGVETKSASARAALDENNTLTTEVLTVIRDSGVAPEDVQTSRLSIYPSRDSNDQIDGYQVTNTVTATLRDMAAAGAVIDTVATTAGDAVRVHHLSMAIDDDTALRATARADAVRQAQTQAQQLADAAGVRLGPVRSITEASPATPYPYAMAASGEAADAGAVPIEPGSQEVTIVVDVVYDIAS